MIHQLEQRRRPAAGQTDEQAAERRVAVIGQHIAVTGFVHQECREQPPIAVVVKLSVEYGLAVLIQNDGGWNGSVVHRAVVVNEKQTGLNERDPRHGGIRNFVGREVDLCAGRSGKKHQGEQRGGEKSPFCQHEKKPPCIWSLYIRRHTERKISEFYEIFENERREVRKPRVSGGDWGKAPAFSHSPIISSSTIFVQRSMLSAAICSYGPWKAKPPVQRFGVGRPM